MSRSLSINNKPFPISVGKRSEEDDDSPGVTVPPWFDYTKVELDLFIQYFTNRGYCGAGTFWPWLFNKGSLH